MKDTPDRQHESGEGQAARPVVHNNTLGTLRFLFQIARKAGARHDDPSADAPKSSIPKTTLRLPERPQFIAFVEAIRTAGAWCSKACADLVEFFAYTGARKNEAANVVGVDVDFNRSHLFIREGKGGTTRHVPLIREAQELIARMRAERPDEPLTDPCQSSMRRTRRWTRRRRKRTSPTSLTTTFAIFSRLLVLKAQSTFLP